MPSRVTTFLIPLDKPGRIHNSRPHEHARRASGARRPRFRDRRRAARAARRAGILRVLDQIDRRLESGGIDVDLAGRLAPPARLPRRRARARSSHLTAGWRWSASRPRARSAGTRRGRWANGRAPIRSRCSSCSRPTPCRSARSAAPRARSAGSTRSPIGCATMRRARRGENIAAHYDLGNDFYSAWLDETMTYSSARFAAPGDSLEDAQLRKIRILLDRLDAQARPAPARDRLRLGHAGDRGGEARRERRRPDACRPSRKAWAEQQDRRGRPVGQDRDPPPGLSRHRRAVRRRRLGRDGRGGRPALVGRLSRLHRPQPEARRPRRAAVHRDRPPICSTATRATPTSSRPTSSPAACCSTSRASQRWRASAACHWEDRDGFGLDYAETLKRWRERYDAGGRARRAARLRRAVPRALALLSHVLRRRLSRRRDRRRPGDADEALAFSAAASRPAAARSPWRPRSSS